MTCQETTLSLGVYLLGALEPTEQATIEAHLAQCAQCRSQLAELAELPSMLERISLDDIAPEPLVPSNDLYERVAARARAEVADELAIRRRRYRRLTAVAAALVVVVVGGIGSWAIVGGNSSSSPPAQTAGVRMTVALASQATGTGYTVEVSGLPIDEHCKLIAIAKDGTRDVAGQWNATYQGLATETGSTRIPRSDLARFVLLGTSGERLATVAV